MDGAWGLSTNLCKRFPLFCLPRLRTMPAARRSRGAERSDGGCKKVCVNVFLRQ
jgi:hypothetical protein